MNHAQATLGVAAAIVVVAAALLLQHAPLSKTVTARFWFDEVAFAVPSFGDAFGAPGYVRLSFATDDDSIRSGCGRGQAWLEQLQG